MIFKRILSKKQAKQTNSHVGIWVIFKRIRNIMFGREELTLQDDGK